MNLSYYKHADGEVWRVVTAFDRGWFNGKRIVSKTKLAQDFIDEVIKEENKNGITTPNR